MGCDWAGAPRHPAGDLARQLLDAVRCRPLASWCAGHRGALGGTRCQAPWGHSLCAWPARGAPCAGRLELPAPGWRAARAAATPVAIRHGGRVRLRVHGAGRPRRAGCSALPRRAWCHAPAPPDPRDETEPMSLRRAASPPPLSRARSVAHAAPPAVTILDAPGAPVDDTRVTVHFTADAGAARLRSTATAPAVHLALHDARRGKRSHGLRVIHRGRRRRRGRRRIRAQRSAAETSIDAGLDGATRTATPSRLLAAGCGRATFALVRRRRYAAGIVHDAPARPRTPRSPSGDRRRRQRTRRPQPVA